MRLALALCFSISLCSIAHAFEPRCDADVLTKLNKSVVGIELPVLDAAVNPTNGLSAVHLGTAWFIGPHTLVTIGHVVEGTELSPNEWSDIVLVWSSERDKNPDHRLEVRARVETLALGDPKLEPAVIIKLESDVAGFSFAKIREAPLKRDDLVVAIGYTHKTLRFATGRFSLPKPTGEPPDPDAKEPPPYLPFELYDPDKNDGVGDRYAIDHGSSGGPVADCDGKVVALSAEFLTRPFSFGLPGMKPLKITSAWGETNVYGIPATPVLDIKKK